MAGIFRGALMVPGVFVLAAGALVCRGQDAAVQGKEPVQGVQRGRPGANLTTVPDVTLSKVAHTEEEEEEQRGQPSGGDYRWENLPDRRTSFEVTATPAEILHYLRPQRTIHEHGAKLPQDQYHIKVIAASADLFKNAAKAFEEVFRVRIEDGSREVDGMRLEVADLKVLKGLPRPEGGEKDAALSSDDSRPMRPRQPPAGTPGEAVVEGTMGELAERLSQELVMPVLDGAHLAAAYRIKLQWGRDKPLEGLEKSLEGQGLRLVAAKATEEGIHIDPVAPGPTAGVRKVPAE